MSTHQSASFINSCIIAPRHPKTNLPTTVLERKSLEFGNPELQTELREDLKDSMRSFHHPKSFGMERVLKYYQALPSMTIAPPNNNIEGKIFSKQSSSNKKKGPSTAPNRVDKGEKENSSFSLFDTTNSVTLKNLINDDDQFFQHLQYLKAENQKTLRKIEKIYIKSLDQKKKSTESEQRNDPHIDERKSGKFYHSNNDNQHEMPMYYLYNEGCDEKISNGSSEELQTYNESSEDELDEQLKIKVPESHVNILPDEQNSSLRGRSSSYDVIANMWENFSVDEYVPYSTDTKKVDNTIWSPTVTIPEPFKMTIRDERKARTKSKRIEQIEEELLQKRLSEEAELNKRIIPTPIPPTTFLPLYDEIKQHQEHKRQYVRDLSQQILKSSESPFSFIKREEAKKEMKRSLVMDNLRKQRRKEKEKKKQFKANPYPEKLFDLTLADKMAEQEEYRKIKIKLRAEEMLASSSLPNNMKTRGNLRYYPVGEKSRRVREELRKRKEKSFHPQIHHDIPDFELMQKKVEKELEQRKKVNTPTICEPFDLHTAKIPCRRSKFRESVEIKKTTERPPSGRNSINRSRDLQRSYSASLRFDHSPSVTRRSESPAISLNETSILRQERMRQSLEKSKEEQHQKNIEDYKKMKQQAILKKKIAKKAQAHDPARDRDKKTAEKLKSFREADHARRREYKDYLREMDSKLDDRPLLFERESQTNAKRKAQRRYEEILQQAGVEGDVLQSVMNGSKDFDLSNQLEIENYSDDTKHNTDDGSYIVSNSDNSDEDVSKDGASIDESADEMNDSESDNDGSYVPAGEQSESSKHLEQLSDEGM